MNHSNILKRSWQILWAYRALWVFGFLLAITTVSGNPGNNSSTRMQQDQSQQTTPSQPRDWGKNFPGEFKRIGERLQQLVDRGMTPELQSNMIIAAIIIIVVVFLLVVFFTILRYLSEVSLIKMVNDYEDTGEKYSIRKGFRLGWSRAAWRLFLIDLLISFPLVFVFGGLIAGAVVLAIHGINAGQVSGIVSVVTGVGLTFLLLFIVVLLAIALGVLSRYFYRSCVLEDQGVIESIRQGYGLARRHLKDTGILALIMLGINIAFPILMLPVGLLLFAVSILFGGGSALAVGGLTGLFSGDPSMASIISTILVGGTIFIMIMAIPLNFLRGLKLTYQSSAWTLAFRELKALEALELEPGKKTT